MRKDVTEKVEKALSYQMQFTEQGVCFHHFGNYVVAMTDYERHLSEVLKDLLNSSDD